MKIAKTLEKIHTREGSGAVTAPPEAGFKRLWFVIRTHYVMLVYLNALFVLFSIPIFTIPAAQAALNRCLFDLDRHGAISPWQDYLKAFLQALKRSPLYILVMLGFCAMALLFLFLLLMPADVAMFSNISFVLSVAVCIFLWNLLSYALLMEAIVNLKPAIILKNAAILTFTQWKTTTVITAISVFFYLIIALLLPYSISILVLFGFSLLHVLSRPFAMKPIEKYVLTPSHPIPANGCSP
jgi:hypothetical protein